MAYIYLIKGGNSYKIGIAENPQKRVRALQTGSAVHLELIRAVECLDAKKIEEHLHHSFRRKRQMGEWFNLSEKDLEIFDKHVGILKSERLRIIQHKKKIALTQNGEATETPIGKPWVERSRNQQKKNYYLRERQFFKRADGTLYKKFLRYIGKDDAA